MTAATTLQAEVDAVMADVWAYDGTAISGLTYALGRRNAVANHSPPRVIFIVSGGPGSPPQKHDFPGGRRSLLTRNPSLRAICWAADTDAAIDLATAVLAACERRWMGRFTYQGEQWEDDPALTDLGEAVTLTFAMQLAVLDLAPTRATVSTATASTTDAVTGDGTLHVGENP